MRNTIAQNVAVDISKNTLDVHLHPDGTARAFARNRNGFSALIGWLGGFEVGRVMRADRRLPSRL
jgi:transposase